MNKNSLNFGAQKRTVKYFYTHIELKFFLKNLHLIHSLKCIRSARNIYMKSNDNDEM